MSAALPAQLQPTETPQFPPVIYFWGSYRSHVNRVATEYAYRLHSHPMWLDIADPRAVTGSPEIGGPIPARRTHILRAGKEVRLTPGSGPAATGPMTSGPSGRTPSGLESEPEAGLVFPAAVRAALRQASRIGSQRGFVLSNLDRLMDLYPMSAPGLAGALLRTFRERGLTLILTSEGLLPLGHLDFACTFEVAVSPGREWWESEVRPGIPVSCCTMCPGSKAGAYAMCGDELRGACPALVPFSEMHR